MLGVQMTCCWFFFWQLEGRYIQCIYTIYICIYLYPNPKYIYIYMTQTHMYTYTQQYVDLGHGDTSNSVEPWANL